MTDNQALSSNALNHSSDTGASANSAPAERIPREHALAIRTLSHDLSNALEIIVQTTYLLGTTELGEPASDWHRLLEQGVQKAVAQNQSLRDYLKANTTV